jgi:hypothetical protein
LFARVIIHAYNHHVRLLSPEPLVSTNHSLPGAEEPALLCNQVGTESNLSNRVGRLGLGAFDRGL